MLRQKKIRINSNGSLSKNDAAELVSMIPHMDKDLAIKAIEQFPNYCQTATSLVEHLSEVCSKIIDDNSLSMKAVTDTYNSVLEDLRVILGKDDLTFEERRYVTEKIIEVADKIADKDTENKNFLFIIFKWIAALGVTIVALLGAALGITYIKNKHD